MRRLSLAHAAVLVASARAADRAPRRARRIASTPSETARICAPPGSSSKPGDRFKSAGERIAPARTATIAPSGERVLTAIPTVTLAARERSGNDLSTSPSRSTASASNRTAGRPARSPLDPGVHTLRFESAWTGAQEETLVVRAGEKNRAVSPRSPSTHPVRADPVEPSAGEPSITTVHFPWPVPCSRRSAWRPLAAAAIPSTFRVTQAHELRAALRPRCSQETVRFADASSRRELGARPVGRGGARRGGGLSCCFRPTFVVLPRQRRQTLNRGQIPERRRLVAVRANHSNQSGCTLIQPRCQSVDFALFLLARGR